MLLGVFAGLPALSIDLSAPTLTILPVALNTTVLQAGLTLSLFMVGFGFGQFFGGRLSDRHGRRTVLIGSLAIYILGAICCCIATSGAELVASRFIQGAGAGACAVQATAMVQDLFAGEIARRKQAYVTVVITIMPMLAPVLGAFMVDHLGWRSVHLVLAIAGAMLLAIVVTSVRESRTGARSISPGLGFRAGTHMLSEAWFLRIAVTNALSYGAIFAYIAGAPVIVMGVLGYPTYVYSALFASTAVASTLGALGSARIGGRGLATRSLIARALLIQAAANLVLVTAGQWATLTALAIAGAGVVACCFGRGLAAPNFTFLGVSGHRENAGLATAMLGLVQLLMGAASSAVVAGLLPRYGLAAVAMPMAVLSCSALACWRLTNRPPAPPQGRVEDRA